MGSRLDVISLINRMVSQHVLFLFIIQDTNSLPLPKIEGDDRAHARALSIIYSHPVVSLLSLKNMLSSFIIFYGAMFFFAKTNILTFL